MEPNLDSKPDLNELVAQDRQQREQSCMEQVQAALKEFNCSLVAETVYRNGQLAGHRLVIAAN